MEAACRRRDALEREGLNRIAHLLSRVPYREKKLPKIEIPPRQKDEGYVRPPRDVYTYVPRTRRDAGVPTPPLASAESPPPQLLTGTSLSGADE
jgi:hypothetical protein